MDGRWALKNGMTQHADLEMLYELIEFCEDISLESYPESERPKYLSKLMDSVSAIYDSSIYCGNFGIKSKKAHMIQTTIWKLKIIVPFKDAEHKLQLYQKEFDNLFPEHSIPGHWPDKWKTTIYELDTSLMYFTTDEMNLKTLFDNDPALRYRLNNFFETLASLLHALSF